MSVYLDPVNQSFADAAAQGDPLYTKSFVEAREILEGIQSFKPASDIKADEIQIEVPSVGGVATVIFRSANATGKLPIVFYTHGGGWILGRSVPCLRPALFDCFLSDQDLANI